MIGIAEIRRRTAFALLEDTIEVGDIVEARLETDLNDRGGGVYQLASSVTESDVYDIIGERTSSADLEETAEGSRSHACQIGYCVEADLLLEVLVDVVLDFADASAVWSDLD